MTGGNQRRAILRAIVGAAATAAVGGALWRIHAAQDRLALVARRGRVRIGYAVEFPFAFVDANGRVTGESPETARLVADRLRWQVEWVQTDFDALLPDLQDDRFDLAAAGLFVTRQRERLVHFARPELVVSAGLLVGAGMAHAPASYEELARATRLRAAVIADSAEYAELQAMQGPRLLVVPDTHAGATAVATGLVDVLAVSYPTVRALAKTRPGLRAVRVADPQGAARVAAAFRLGDQRLLAAWNAGLAEVLGTESHRRVLAAIGFDPARELPALSHPGGRRP